MVEPAPGSHTAAPDGSGVDLFLSFNSQDRAAVESVRSALERHGVTTFLDRMDLAPGMPWAEVLDDAVARARALAVFVGRGGLGSWQRREMMLALDRQAREAQRGRAFPVVPVLLPGADRDAVPGFLRLNTWVDLRRGVDDPAGLDALAAVARRAREYESAAGAPERATADVPPDKSTRRGPMGAPKAGRRPRSRPTRGALALGVFGAAAAGAAIARAGARPDALTVYRVRVTVVDARNTPVDDARVWSDQGGEVKQVSGGWQFDIAAAAVTSGGRLVVRAAREGAFETAADSLPLGAEANPTVTLRLRADTTALVRGIVVDGRGGTLAGARVAVAGYASEGIETGADGAFTLPAHAAVGQQVLLRAEKRGLGATTLYHSAGDEPATLRFVRAASTPLAP